jgi:hypothetical protein
MISDLIKTHTPLEKFRVTWLEREGHTNYNVQLLDYQDNQGHSSGIYGVYKRDYCSCSPCQWSNTFLGFEIARGGSVENIIQKLKQTAEKRFPHDLDPQSLHLTPLFYLVQLSSLSSREDSEHISRLTKDIKQKSK